MNLQELHIATQYVGAKTQSLYRAPKSEKEIVIQSSDFLKWREIYLKIDKAMNDVIVKEFGSKEANPALQKV